MSISFKNRIALNLIISTALLVLLIYISIYIVVQSTVYKYIDEDLDFESAEITGNLIIKNDDILYSQLSEWTEGEHGAIEVNPTYIQILDSHGNLLRKSDNLKDLVIGYASGENKDLTFNSYISVHHIRLKQTPVKNSSGVIIGYLTVALPLKDTDLVLLNLRKVLFISYPFILILLFFYSKYAAGKSIDPVNKIITTAEKITHENLKDRIDMPVRKDEIYLLVKTINDLLERIEITLKRESQFISDVSHELRTPLAIIRGNLELLIRKPRSVEEYNEKINYAISETDRISLMVDNLLNIARFENSDKTEFTEVSLEKILNNVADRFRDMNISRKDRFCVNYENDLIVRTDAKMLEIILDNLLSNAVKYSDENSPVEINACRKNNIVSIDVIDHGIGIDDDKLNKIFDRFYRDDRNGNMAVSGFGVGLSITKKLADILNIKINVVSKKGEGSVFTLHFS